jgi:hypothetical protein
MTCRRASLTILIVVIVATYCNISVLARTSVAEIRKHRLWLQAKRESERVHWNETHERHAPPKNEKRAEAIDVHRPENISRFWTDGHPMREVWIDVPRALKSHRYTMRDYVTEVRYVDELKRVRVRSNVPCNVLDNAMLNDDNYCFIVTKSGTPFQISMVANPNPTSEKLHWAHCSVFGASGTLVDHADESKRFVLHDTDPFEVNKHNSIAKFAKLGNNTGPIKHILHATHFRNELIKGKKPNVFSVVAVKNQFEQLSAAKAPLLNCNSYAYIALTKRRFIGGEALGWESYCGTNAVFGLVGRCGHVDVYGFFDTEHAINTQYGVTEKERSYGPNHADYVLLLLMHSCGMITLKY